MSGTVPRRGQVPLSRRLGRGAVRHVAANRRQAAGEIRAGDAQSVHRLRRVHAHGPGFLSVDGQAALFDHIYLARQPDDFELLKVEEEKVGWAPPAPSLRVRNDGGHGPPYRPLAWPRQTAGGSEPAHSACTDSRGGPASVAAAKRPESRTRRCLRARVVPLDDKPLFTPLRMIGGDVP